MNVILEFLNDYHEIIFWIAIVIAALITLVDSLKMKGNKQISFLNFYKQSLKRSIVFIVIAILILIFY